MNLPIVSYKILYDNKNITTDVSKHLITLTYTDKVDGESDELELSLEDSDLLWQNDWYPKKGAKLTATIQQEGFELNCGTFTIDEIELKKDRNGGDTVTVRGLAAFITKKLRTKHTRGHENKTLREICNTIAAAHGLTVQGTIENIPIRRVTQVKETDLHFLAWLAADYGYTFSIRENTMIFTSIYELEGKNHILTIDKTDLISWSLKDKTSAVYKSATVKHHSSTNNEDITGTQEFDDSEFEGDDSLELRIRAENKQQAEAKAKSHLHKNNSLQKSGNITMPGHVLMVSGINFELTGLGNLSGIQHIISSTHKLDRSGGYVCSSEIKAVDKISKSKWKPKKKVTKRTDQVGGFLNYLSNSLVAGYNAAKITK